MHGIHVQVQDSLQENERSTSSRIQGARPRQAFIPMGPQGALDGRPQLLHIFVVQWIGVLNCHFHVIDVSTSAGGDIALNRSS